MSMNAIFQISAEGDGRLVRDAKRSALTAFGRIRPQEAGASLRLEAAWRVMRAACPTMLELMAFIQMGMEPQSADRQLKRQLDEWIARFRSLEDNINRSINEGFAALENVRCNESPNREAGWAELPVKPNLSAEPGRSARSAQSANSSKSAKSEEPEGPARPARSADRIKPATELAEMKRHSSIWKPNGRDTETEPTEALHRMKTSETGSAGMVRHSLNRSRPAAVPFHSDSTAAYDPVHREECLLQLARAEELLPWVKQRLEAGESSFLFTPALAEAARLEAARYRRLLAATKLPAEEAEAAQSTQPEEAPAAQCRQQLQQECGWLGQLLLLHAGELAHGLPGDAAAAARARAQSLAAKLSRWREGSAACAPRVSAARLAQLAASFRAFAQELAAAPARSGLRLPRAYLAHLQERCDELCPRLERLSAAAFGAEETPEQSAYAESALERYFRPFREGIIGTDQTIVTPHGVKPLIYADWTASGRLYRPIESLITNRFGPYTANTHTESNATGSTMTAAYHEAQCIIKQHVNAKCSDVLITDGSGMTAVVNKLQRILGLRLPEQWKHRLALPAEERPVIFVSHMEHHSNHISWSETIADVVCLTPDAAGGVNEQQLEEELGRYAHRPLRIGAFTACSNVTGRLVDYSRLAAIMHRHGGWCFIDFAACAPYVEIDMHPENPLEKLDAIYFSPHKFLGGPGTSGVLIFDSALHRNATPDHPGGGTVQWTDPWGGIQYLDDVETREDGGTPGFLQAIRTALCIRLKERMGIRQIRQREQELLDLFLDHIRPVPGVVVLGGEMEHRLGIVPLHFYGLHYNLAVKLLNDRFGIQARGGCSCAGTYGHYLFGLDPSTSQWISMQLQKGDSSSKPGWVRISLHPVMTDEEALQIAAAVREIAVNGREWAEDYVYNPRSNQFRHKKETKTPTIDNWFQI